MADQPGHSRSVVPSLPAGPFKPRLVLAFLTVASVGGVLLATGGSWPSAIARWLTVAGAGGLAGGLYWRVVLLDEGLDGTVRSRWHGVRRWLALALLAGVGALLLFRSIPLDTVLGALTLGTLVCLGLISVPTSGRRRRRVALALAAVGLAGLAWLSTPGPGPWAVRTVHLGTFALWFGGALWHNAVVLPTRRTHPGATSPLRDAARRFRLHLPVALALLLSTGGYQVYSLVGTDIATLPGTTVGRVVVLKLTLFAALTALVVDSLRR